MTKKLFQQDVYMNQCESTITGVLGTGTEEDPFLLVLDKTVFFPTGGGQPCDLGTINDVPLADVFEKEGQIFHKLCLGFETWTVGQRVCCKLDWSRRFFHMQRHCGEHILSGIFFRECGGVNRGFHMGADYMTVDIDVPGISWEQALRIEGLTNEVIWSNVPVTTRYFENRSEAEKLPLRKPLAIDEDISIVCVGEESNPADCVACCGTHPATSGQVGLLKIYKLESYKGMTRVYFDAGRNAMEDYCRKHRIIGELNQKYSSDDKDLQEKMRAQEQKNKEVRQELYLLKNTLVSKAVDDILTNFAKEKISPQAGIELTSAGLLIREYPYFKANDLMTAVKALTEKLNPKPIKTNNPKFISSKPPVMPLIALVSTQENVIILASSGNHDCGRIVKDNAQVWRGKGGGNATGARAMFPSRDELLCFISYISQAYGSLRAGG